MSVDFAVFDPEAAPRDGKGFRAWYAEQTDWDLEEPDPDPSTLTPSLRQWYSAMTARYPDRNRSEAEVEDGIDYGFTSHFMYCSMPTSRAANAAWSLAREKASEFGLGTYDCMSDDGHNNSAIIFPEGPLKNEPSFFSKLFGKS